MSSLSAAKIDLSDPDKFQMASIVTKNSRLGITSNKRLLVIKKGYLYYYSNVPKKFKGDSSIVQTIHELPKCSIEIVSIKQIKGYESNSSYFSIQFDQKNMLQRQDIRKTMTLEEYNFSPKNSKESIVWQFTCDNQFVKQRWVAALEGLRDYYNKEKKDIEKFFNEHKDTNSEMKSSSSGGRNSQVPWRQSQSGNGYKRNNDVNYLQLVATKSNDERSQDRSLFPDNKPARQNQLKVPDSPSRVRGNTSSSEQKPSTDFSKQYSPNEPTSKGIGIGSTISVSSSEQDLTIEINHDTKNFQNSPINELELSDVRTSPTKENTQAGNMMFSKTQKVKIQPQMIQEEESQSVRTPGRSPVKALEESSAYENEGDDFEKNLEFLEGHNTRSQPNVRLPFETTSNDNSQSNTNGKGMFHEIMQDKQSPQKTRNNEIVNSAIHINLNDEIKLLKPQKKVPDTSQQQQAHLLVTQSTSFYHFHTYLFQSELSFHERISVQQQFHKRIHEFSSQGVAYLKQYIESLSASQSRKSPASFKILSKTNNYTVIKPTDSNSILKLALVTSQSLTINGQQKIFLDEQAVKNLKRQFKVYSDIEKYLVLAGVKNDHSFRLRVPLMSLIEYKGVVALVFHQSYMEENQQEDLSKSVSGHLTHQMAKTYHKEIQALKNQGYQTKDFSFSTFIQENQQSYLMLNLLPQIISGKTSKQQAKKFYLKRLLSVKRPQKHHNLEFNPPFTHDLIEKAHLTHASTSIESLQQYIFTLERLQEFRGICPKEQIVEILRMCVFCKQVRKIYRSAQGQIEESHFLNLVLKQDEQMIKMLEQSGCDQIPPLKGVLFHFIEHYLGIKCSVNEKALKDHVEYAKLNQTNLRSNKIKKSDIIESTQAVAMVQTLDISRIELVQASESMRKFISEQKTHLAGQTLAILQNLHLEQFPHLLSQQLELAQLHASLAYLQHDYLKCIQQCKRFEQLLSNSHDPQLFEIYLLMLKSYSHFSQEEFTHTFEKLITLVEFNYAKDNSVLVSVYSISAFFFIQIAEKAPHHAKSVQHLYLLAFKLIDQAEKLCLKLFGETSTQYIDVLMDCARLYETKDQSMSQRYLDRARTIIISTQNNQKLIDYFMYELKQTLNSNQFDKCQKLLNQCEELIHSGKFKLDGQKTIAVLRIKFELGMMTGDKLYLSERAVEQLWRSERIDEKREAVSLAAKLAKKLKLIKEITSASESSQSYISSSVLSQTYEGFAQYRESLVTKVLNLVSQTRYSLGYETEESLMGKIKEILEDEGEISATLNSETLSFMLNKIA